MTQQSWKLSPKDQVRDRPPPVKTFGLRFILWLKFDEFFKFQFSPGCFKGLTINVLFLDPILDPLVKCVALVSSVNLTFIIVFIQFGASFTEKKFL